jgi:SAM-dependent methyltransferase
MIEIAKELNKHGDRCRYVLNTRGDLSVFADGYFDFIYSNITLQHMPPGLMKAYVAEFLRTLAPEGVLVFQLPARPPRTLLYRVKRLVPAPIRNQLRRFRNKLRPRARIQMFWMTPGRVARIVRRSSGRIVAMHEDFSAGPGWSGKRYVVRRREAEAP